MRKRGTGKTNIKCGVCKKSFSVYKCYLPRRKYCSMACRNNAHKEMMLGKDLNGSIEKTCIVCGKIFKTYKSIDSKCCSNKCRHKAHGKKISGENHPNWNGGNKPRWRGPNWKKQRDKALKRDNHYCQKCKSQEQLTVHHIIPYRNFVHWADANKLSNLITLCRSCHMKEERNNPKVERICLPEPFIEIGNYFNCLKCGNKFWRKPSEIKKGHNKYCSRYCSNTRHYRD